ncbi:hypothetical protein ID866_5747 [Astraeus odoratus]|nr:hypothetical protein ID866_5747 [Astraeus odoratus]
MTLSSTMSGCLTESPPDSKREYLIAQIRHKDQIIESLLKQLHNPYTATPLSISAFQMATSPSDKDNVRIVDWMDRLQSSTRPPGKPCPSRTDVLRELRNSYRSTEDAAMDDSDESEDGGETAEGEETEKMTSSLPDAAVPIGLLADLSLDNDKDKGKGRSRPSAGGLDSARAKSDDDDDNVGVANKGYFMPGPANNLNIRKNLIEQHSPPDIVLHGLVAATDVEKLFDIFWNQINPFISLLDRTLHSPSTILQRCPFLFTVICAVSSRYYYEKSEIYPVAMHFAKHSAANALIDGWKSIELCQAYILMSIYAVPARKWEEDRSWLYTGLAIRIATDLNLHQVPTTQPQTEKQERELLNRVRVWMICFNLDHSTATQFGKSSTMKDDYITRHSADWYRKSQYRDKYDIHLCGYTALLRIVAGFHDEVFSDPDSPMGLNKSIDFHTVTLEHDAHLTSYSEEWSKRFNDEPWVFLQVQTPAVHAFQRGMIDSDHVFLQKCFNAATTVIKHMIDVLSPTGLMRSSPDGHFVFASFASAFLLKLLRPEFAPLLTVEMEDEIFELISRLITTLQDLAIDERHTPHLYARFLANLLTRHRKGGAGLGGRMQPNPPTSQLVHQSQPQPHSYSERQQVPSSQMQYPRQSPRDTSQPSYNSDIMQMNPGSFPSIPEKPLAVTPPMPTLTTPACESIPAQPPVPLGAGRTNAVRADAMVEERLSETGTLAAMYALNDAWWGNMMMPGYVYIVSSY